MVESQYPKLGKYELLAEIGRGSMGTVHKARDPVLDRVVALKTILPSAEVQAEARERFLREARSVARLQHPNIITIYELGEVDGLAFIAMEFLEGESLAQASRHGRPADLRGKLEVGLQLCRALGYAHRRGVVHRDIKPSNIFLLPDGTAKLLDFGVAWLEGGTFATRTGMLVGTPAYMAPEQFSGDAVDHRVDQWAVGVILYELLCGRRPFDAGTVPQLIYQIVHSPLPELDAGSGGLPVAAVQVIRRTLQKSPADRYPSLDAVGQALEALLEGGAAAGMVDPTATHLLGQTPPPALRRAAEREQAAPTVAAPSPAPLATVARFQPGSFRDQGVLAEGGPLQVVAVSPDERLLAAGGVDGSIRMWDLARRVGLRMLRNRAHLKSGYAALTTCIAFSSDGRLLAAGHLDGTIDLFDPESGFELEVRLRHEGAVGGLGFTPDGAKLVSGGQDAAMKYWEVAAAVAGEGRRELRRQPAEVTALAVSPRGDLVVTGHGNRNLRVHDAISGRLVATFHGLRAVPSSLAVSPDGGIVACGSRDGVIRLFRVANRALLRSFEGHSKTVSSLVFFPDGRHLASVAMEPEVAVWEVSQDDRLATLSAGGGSAAAGLAMLGRSGRMVCGTASGQIRAWEFA